MPSLPHICFELYIKEKKINCSSAFVYSKPRLAVGQLGLLLHSPNCHTKRPPFLIQHTDFTVPFLICDVSWQKRIVMEENWLNFPVHNWKYCNNSCFSISSKMDVLFLEVSPWSVVATIHHVAAVLTNYFPKVKRSYVKQVREVTATLETELVLHIQWGNSLK